MKKTRKLNLASVAKSEMNALIKAEISKLRGGGGMCGCACRYGDCGGSNTSDNGVANSNQGLHSPNGPLNGC